MSNQKEKTTAQAAGMNRAKPYQLVLFPMNNGATNVYYILTLSLIHISEPTRRTPISYAVFCLKKKKQNQQMKPIVGT